MPKLSLERFREIKKRTAQIVKIANKINNGEIQITDKEIQEINSEMEQLIDEIHSSDLSDIPFEEYEGFYNIGFDFSGTGANIDFNLIHEMGWGVIRVKGCNVKNFDFKNQNFDEESFDEEFMSQYPDVFIDNNLPEEVKERYSLNSLKISDVIKYNLYNQIGRERLSQKAVEFFKKVKPEVARTLNPDLFDIYELEKSILEFLKNNEEEITEDIIKAIITEKLENIVLNERISIDSYKILINTPNIRALIPEDQIIDFGENNELISKYINKNLTINDIIDNKEIFKGKKFLNRISRDTILEKILKDITEEKLFYLFENFPDITKGLESEQILLFKLCRNIDLQASKEENLSEIQKQVIEILEDKSVKELKLDTKKVLERYYSLEAIKSRLSDSAKLEIEIIMGSTTKEKIQEYGILPKHLQNSSIRRLFSIYGLETVMEFDKANGNIFSKNDFELAKEINEYFFSGAKKINDEEKTILYRSDKKDSNTPYSMEDFEECIRRMIVNVQTKTDSRKKQPIYYRNFSQKFKNKYPKMFLPEEAPQELQDKFYTKNLKLEDLRNNPRWITFLEEKDFELGLDDRILNISFYDPNTNTESFLLEKLGGIEKSKSAILRFLIDNEKLLRMLEIYQRRYKGSNLEISSDEIEDIDSLKKYIEKEIETKILSGKLDYGEKDLPDFFKLKHPEFVLDEDAPEKLKEKFYSIYYKDGTDKNIAFLYNLTLEDLANEEYQKYLEGKSFELLQNADTVKNIIKVFDIKTIIDLYKIDPSAFELYCSNLEYANTLKEILKHYPEQYAKEELMQGQQLSEEEFERRLQDEEFKKEFEHLKRCYIEDFIKNPGFVLHLEPEKRSRKTLRQYKMLSSSNILRTSELYTRDTYEEILGHMLGFLGLDEAKRLLEIPKIDEETLDRIYEHDEIIKSLYEKKFDIIGNLRVITNLLEGFPDLMPQPEKITSKATCKLFQSLNKRIQEGYNKDIASLIREILEENNVEVDNDKVYQLVERVIKTSTEQKLDLVREYNSVLIDTSFEENQQTNTTIKILYRNALEYSLNKSERVDTKLVREYLEKEFRRLKENGEPYYSEHVRGHLEELVSFSEELNSNPQWSSKLNHSIVDDLGVEARKIGKGWIRKITSNLCYRLEKLTYEEVERLDSTIYPEESGMEIDTRATIGLKKLSKEEKEKAYELLRNEEYKGLFTLGKAKNMFLTIKAPYSESFRKYFLKYRDEFIAYPKLYSNFPKLAAKFDSYIKESGIKKLYEQGKFTPKELLAKYSKSNPYDNLEFGPGEYELLYQITRNGVLLSEENAAIAKKIYAEMKKREYQTFPQEQYQNRRFRGRVLRLDDPLLFTVGDRTKCCQKIGKGEPGESSMIHSAIERNGGVFIVEEIDETGRTIGIVAQSWIWRNGNRVCFDNVEISPDSEKTLIKIGGFDEIMEVYQEAAKRMIETDRIRMKKLLESGRITKEQYQAMVIKDIGMGLGCDDLVCNISNEKKESLHIIPEVKPLEIQKDFIGHHKAKLYTDSSRQIQIAHNDEFAPNDHTHSYAEVGDYGVRYIKTRDIFRRKGIDIDPDKIELISKMIEKVGRADSVFSTETKNIFDIANRCGIKDLEITDEDRMRLSMSEKGDWYILYEENENGIIMLESGIDTTEPETEIEKIDRRMALSEYTREVYIMLYDAATRGKPITIDSYSFKKFINLDLLIKEEIISLENGAIIVKDKDRIAKIISECNKTIDNQRRERLKIPDKNEIEK